MLKYILLSFYLIVGCLASQAQEKPYVVVLSLDGFRWDYPDSISTPNLHKMQIEGVRAKSLIPSFPSVTFPNHYTLATGLYPDHHGIVHNSFYDSDIAERYKIDDRKAVEDNRFYGGEPIWNTAEKQGVKAATFFWVGSETDVQNMHPSYWKKYDKTISYEQRIDTVMHWLSLPSAVRPHLIMFYIDEPDHTSHTYGPQSTQTRAVVMHLDSLIGVFYEKLSHLPINKQVNFIVLSDHGMGAINNNRRINIDEYLPRRWFNNVNGHNPVYMLDANENCADSIINTLKTVKHIQVWKKADIPSHLHYGTNKRVGDIVIAADSAYSLAWKNSNETNGGAHGYDPQNSDVHAIFFATGPAFKERYSQKSFQNIDVYSIIAHILQLSPAKTDGSIENVKNMFTK